MKTLENTCDKFIIHIADASKFLDGALRLFEKIRPQRNVVFIRERNPSFVVREVDSAYVFYQNTNRIEYERQLANYGSKALGVIVHFLNNEYKRNTILSFPKSIPIVWSSWGPDLFVGSNSNQKLYAPLTTKLINEKHGFTKNTIYRIYGRLNKNGIISRLMRFLGRQTGEALILKAIERTNFLITVVPNEYDIFKKAVNYKGGYIRWNYDPFLSLPDSLVNGSKVLVGHSSHSINNHFDCFDALIRKKVEVDVVMPCSYGNINYRDQIISTGKKLFGSHFFPITDFMSFTEYARLLQGCSTAIMGQYCQQGVGTSIILLWQGSKLFLSERNPMYVFFKSNHLHCFSLENDLIEENITEPLSKDRIFQNRDILIRLYGHTQLDSNTQKLCEILESFKENN